MTQNLTWEKIELQLYNPFRLSYGVSQTRPAYWIRLKNDEGWGEGTIPPYYGITEKDMVLFWAQAAKKTAHFPSDISTIKDWIGNNGPAPARAALDLALHDRLGRKYNVPLYKLLGIPYPKPKPSAVTITMETPKSSAEMALRLTAFPIIKLKLGRGQDDIEILRAVRIARPNTQIWVDANAGWQLNDAIRLVKDLEKFQVELLEQPLDKQDFIGLGRLQSATSIPIVADESVQEFKDIEALADEGIKGVNIKLMKVGGITPALKMIRQAKNYGLKVMLGCMIETAIGTTAMAHLSSYADWLDLDASLLIKNDPFSGMSFDENANIQINEKCGIGVTYNI